MADSEEDSSMDDVVNELESRIDTLEDRVMMERLEDLALEDKLDIVENLVERDEETVKEKLEMLDQIEEKYEDIQVEEKLQYLYKELKSLKSTVNEMSEGQVREDDLSELRGRIDRLESKLEKGGAASDEELDDVYDKIYTLRDKIKELTEKGETSEYSFSDSEIDDLVSKVESRLDTESSDVSEISATDLKEEVLSDIDASDISEAALGDLRDEIDRLRDRIETHEELKGSNNGGEKSEDVLSRISELEGKIDEIEHQDMEEVENIPDLDSEAIEELQIEMNELQEEIAETAKEDLESEIEALKEKVEDHDERLSIQVSQEGDEELGETEERIQAIQKSLEEEISHLKEEEIQPLKERVEGMETENIDDIEDRIEYINERSEDIEERIDIDSNEILKALGYEGDELEERFKNILFQIEQLREMIGRQGERIDSLSHAQNIFESNIGEMIQEHRDITEQLQEEDRKLDRKTNLLLEALEEGMDIEAKELEEHEERSNLQKKETDLLREALNVVEEDEKVDSRLKEKIEEVKKINGLVLPEDVKRELGIEEGGINAIAEIAAQNQKRVQKLQEKLEDMEREAPTIVE